MHMIYSGEKCSTTFLTPQHKTDVQVIKLKHWKKNTLKHFWKGSVFTGATVTLLLNLTVTADHSRPPPSSSVPNRLKSCSIYCSHINITKCLKHVKLLKFLPQMILNFHSRYLELNHQWHLIWVPQPVKEKEKKKKKNRLTSFPVNLVIIKEKLLPDFQRGKWFTTSFAESWMWRTAGLTRIYSA